MEKLGQLRRYADETGSWDLIVVDTPPSRSALDFLDAPERLSSFLDGRFIRLLLAPARGPVRLMSAGLSAITNALTKVIGAQVLRDMQTFVAAFDTLFGGFRQRAQETFTLLQSPGTTFLVVASPEADSLREAAYFVERLDGDKMPLGGLVINRAGRPVSTPPTLEETVAAADRLDAQARPLAAGLLRLHADRMKAAAREERLKLRFHRAHPHVPWVTVPALPTDVHDLAGLQEIGDLLQPSGSE